MDDRAVGAGIRATRVRRGWRQVDVAAAARVSQPTVSRVERGLIDGVPIETLRSIAAALELGVEVRLRSRDGGVDRLVNSRHAALAEAVVRWIRGLGDWDARPEISFNVFGERGAIDLVAWHAGTRTVIVIELKTEVVDVGETLATFDRKIRLAARVVTPLGWQPVRVGAVLIVATSATNRRRVLEHRETFRASLPDGIVALRRWLVRPDVAAPQALRALVFFSDSHHRNVRSGFAAIRRVRRPPARAAEHEAGVRRASPGRRAAPIASLHPGGE